METHIKQALDNSALLNLYFLISQVNICCGFSKEPFQEDGSFKHPTQMFGRINMEVFTIIHLNPANLELCLVR